MTELSAISGCQAFVLALHNLHFTMTGTEFIILLIVAGVIGAIGESLAGYSAGGCLTSIALGFVGGLLGRWMAAKFGLPDLFVLNIGGAHIPVVWSIIGAAVFVAILGLLRPRRWR